MNLTSLSPEKPKPSAPARPTIPDAERDAAAALTSARAKAKKLAEAYKSNKLHTWAEVAAELGVTAPSGVELSYVTLLSYLQLWIAQAPTRAAAERARITEELENRTRRKFGTVDIKLPPNLKFKPQQAKAISAVLDVLLNQKLSGALTPLGTGKGKSWIATGLALYLQQNDPATYVNGWMGFLPRILIVTKKSVVRDFKDVLKLLGVQNIGMTVDVISFNALMTQQYAMFFKESTEEVFGQPTKTIKFALPAECAPDVIIVDEVQDLKKWKSKRTKYLAAFLDFPHIKWLFTSATPAVTLEDTLFMTLAMRVQYAGRVVDRELFPEFIRSLNTPGHKVSEPNAAALDRWSVAIGDRYIKPPNDPWKFKVYNQIKLFAINDAANRKMVENAMSNYKDAIARQGREMSTRGETMLYFLVMARAVELATVDQWVEDAIEAHKQGFAPIVALRFVESLKDFVLKLSESEYFKSLNYTRNKISLVWGGQAEIKEEDLLPQDRVADIANRITKFALRDDTSRMPTAAEIGITVEEYRAFKKGIRYQSERIFREMTKDAFRERNLKLRAMNLHNQTQDQRYESVHDFLEGRTEFCVFTLSAGGTGISLDHRYEHVRPRRTLSTLCYWAEEFAQALGRGGGRASSISDTEQFIYIPLGTLLHTHMAPKLARKLTSIDAIGSSNIDFAAALETAVRKAEKEETLTADDLAKKESSGVIETEEDGDEEDE